MLGLAPSTTEIMDNCKLAREMSQTSMVYYQGVITQISKLLSVMEQPGRQAGRASPGVGACQEHSDLSFFSKEGQFHPPAKQKRMSPPETKTSSARPPPPSPGGGAQAEEGEGQLRGG